MRNEITVVVMLMVLEFLSHTKTAGWSVEHGYTERNMKGYGGGELHIVAGSHAFSVCVTNTERTMMDSITQQHHHPRVRWMGTGQG